MSNVENIAKFLQLNIGILNISTFADLDFYWKIIRYSNIQRRRGIQGVRGVAGGGWRERGAGRGAVFGGVGETGEEKRSQRDAADLLPQAEGNRKKGWEKSIIYRINLKFFSQCK